MSYIITAEQLAKVTEALADAEGFMETMTDGPDDNEFLEHSRYEAVSAAKQLLLSIAPDDPGTTGAEPLAPTAYVCNDCESDDVVVDAYAQWCTTTQEWELSTTFEGSEDYCRNCDGPSRCHEIPLSELVTEEE